MKPEQMAENLPGTRLTRKDLRVLTVDIERLPGEAYVWGPKTRYIGASNFKTWPSTLCLAARWYGESTPMFYSTWEHGWHSMVKAAWSLYDEADVVITYNGVSFDNKHLKSDWLMADLGLPSPWKDLDLLRVVRKQFGFESKSLDVVTKRLGRGGKSMHYNIDMAFAASEGDKEAQATLKQYNIGDVELTEWLADRLRGYMPGHPLAPVTTADTSTGLVRCNQCLSTDLELQHKKYRAVVANYDLWRCNTCRGWVRGAWGTRVATGRGV